MNQQKVWNNIAPEWHEFKTTPSKNATKFLKSQSGKVLDLGSGSGRNLMKIKNGKMYLVDFSEQMIKLAKKKSKEIKIDAEFSILNVIKLPFENNFFDSALCICVLHCIEGKENREKTIQELYRVLKPNTQAYIGVWNFKSKRFKNSRKEKLINWRDKGKRYYYLFDEKEVHDLFKKIGFKIISTHNSEMMINFIVEKPISS